MNWEAVQAINLEICDDIYCQIAEWLGLQRQGSDFPGSNCDSALTGCATSGKLFKLYGFK